ncbi:MAG: hypothetical protein JWP80_364 [Pseudomonas sp.]|nr:hypothetical protein [Pseudomonas sp.]
MNSNSIIVASNAGLGGDLFRVTAQAFEREALRMSGQLFLPPSETTARRPKRGR